MRSTGQGQGLQQRVCVWGGEIVIWKEVRKALSRREAERGKAAVRCLSLKLGTGDMVTVGGDA